MRGFADVIERASVLNLHISTRSCHGTSGVDPAVVFDCPLPTLRSLSFVVPGSQEPFVLSGRFLGDVEGLETLDMCNVNMCSSAASLSSLTHLSQGRCGARGSPTAGSQPQPGERSTRRWTKQALVPSLAVSIWMPLARLLARSRYQLRTQRSVYYRLVPIAWSTGPVFGHSTLGKRIRHP
jgi:hypothetical protein